MTWRRGGRLGPCEGGFVSYQTGSPPSGMARVVGVRTQAQSGLRAGSGLMDLLFPPPPSYQMESPPSYSYQTGSVQGPG